MEVRVLSGALLSRAHWECPGYRRFLTRGVRRSPRHRRPSSRPFPFVARAASTDPGPPGLITVSARAERCGSAARQPLSACADRYVAPMLHIFHREYAGRPIRVAWTLEELGQPYDVTVMNYEEGIGEAHRGRHPLGRVPVLQSDDGFVFESTAICLHLADSHPDGGLIAPSGTHERALAYQWSCFAPAELRAAADRGCDLRQQRRRALGEGASAFSRRGSGGREVGRGRRLSRRQAVRRLGHSRRHRVTDPRASRLSRGRLRGPQRVCRATGRTARIRARVRADVGGRASQLRVWRGRRSVCDPVRRTPLAGLRRG